MWWWGAGMIICLEQGADLHITQLMPLPLSLAPVNPYWFYQNGSASLVPAYPGCPRKKAVKQTSHMGTMRHL